MRTFHKRKEKSDAAKSELSFRSKRLKSRKLQKDFHKIFAKTKETKIETERPSSGTHPEAQTITGNAPYRDETSTHLYPLQLKRFEKKEKQILRRKGYLLKIANLPKQQSTGTEIS